MLLVYMYLHKFENQKVKLRDNDMVKLTMISEINNPANGFNFRVSKTESKPKTARDLF